MKLGLTFDVSTNRRFVLLPPPGRALQDTFRRVDHDADWRQDLLTDMQRLRGRVYLRDRAIQEDDLSKDGRHVHPADEQAWHLLILNHDDRVVGCTRYLQHSGSTCYKRLGICSASMARSEDWREPLRRAVQRELREARRSGFSSVEVGGWAVDESIRRSSDAVRSVLFIYAWAQAMGGCLGLSVATHRNGSASILRRIGGFPLEWNGQELPSYYDLQYGCDMEVIRFDSRCPSPRFQRAIDEIKSELPTIQVISAEQSSNSWHSFVNRLHGPAGALVPLSSERTAPASVASQNAILA